MIPRQLPDSFESEQLSRRQALAAIGAAGVAGLAGCADGNGGTAGDTQAEDIEIRYIPHGAPGEDPFWEAQDQGWNTAVDQLGVTASYQGPEESSAFTEQVDNIETAIDAGVDAIAVTLPDPPLFQDALQRAEDEGIYVTVTNVTERGEQTMPWTGYIGQDEGEVGEELASRSLPLFESETGSPPSGAVILNHDPGHSALALRQEGIESVLDNNNVPHDWIEVPAGDPSGVISQLASHRSNNPDVNLVFTLGPVAGEPALSYIEDEGLQGEVYHAGVDISQNQANAVEEGYNLAQVIQQPALQGYLAAHYLTSNALWGILTPEHTPTGPTFVSAENVDSVMTQIETFGVA
ncbi:substrate-binding domain-containing protein [Halalkalicoccus sp. NIPERK01]|uniref:substrate-binding domain-containing protein n=1 Tax=Halalkalicoccus sp. NIPERK01 TaxID=3053469 RepID=UPI00256F10B2|nr:substrate-binding domain-containing protein [Halalkalicoccus sp. NIPERK01]MDL5363262.1 substrate-binding domain-containing protein [Halalkalicoccus sp. NIPERK01]